MLNQESCVSKKLCQNIDQSQIQPDCIISPQAQFENVSLNNTKNVTFGNKTFYNGPVTINQFQVNTVTDQLDSSIDTDNLSSNTKSGNYKNNLTENNGKPCFLGIRTVRRKTLIVIVVFILIIIVTLVIILSVLFSEEAVAGSIAPEPNTVDVDNNLNNGTENNGNSRIMSRQEWFAQPPKSSLVNLKVPVANVVISHTAGGNCFDKKSCSYLVQNIQNYHQTRGFEDIGFNFLIGGDGFVYEGRGWNKRGAHTGIYNNRSVCLAFIGKFTEQEPNAKQIDAAEYLLKLGLEEKKLTSDYCIFAQMQLIATESPGLSLYHIIRKWPHWCNAYS